MTPHVTLDRYITKRLSVPIGGMRQPATELGHGGVSTVKRSITNEKLNSESKSCQAMHQRQEPLG